jgi:NAD(P)H dehydrogenase (quinone)
MSLKEMPFTNNELEKIAAKFPTPFHIYDEKAIRENARDLLRAFQWDEGFKEYFAVKATPNPFILKILKSEGFGTDCSSLPELLLSEKAGIVGTEIMFSSNDTPTIEFQKARQLGAIINLDDLSDIPFLEKNGGIPEIISVRYNPVLPAAEIPAGASPPPAISAHCREIAEAEGIVIVHPNWWGQPPALLKGWIDRVIRPGVAYNFLEGDSGEGVPVGLLRAKTAIVFNTANTPAEREKAAFGDPLELIWRNCVFALCGVADVRREVFGVVVTSTGEQRNVWLDRVRGLVTSCFPAAAS